MLLNPDDTIQFTADFKDRNLSLPVFADERGVEYRLGVYRSVIHKPHETILSVSATGGHGLFVTPMMGVDLRWDSLKSDTSGLGIDDFELSGTEHRVARPGAAARAATDTQV